MASKPTHQMGMTKAVEAAMEELHRVQRWGDKVFVNLPLIFPSGALATVRVSPAEGGFRVDDGGFAYREIESIGAERSFSRTASKIVERNDLELNRRAIFVYANEEELGRAICDVALASHAVAEQIHRKSEEQEEGEIEDYLHERLVRIFGEAKVEESRSIKGSSSNPWEVSAILHVEGRATVFQAVGSHANSVYRASTAFHDLAELPTPPRLVAVVKNKAALGPKLSILSQAGRVIQSDQPDEVYRRVAA